MGSLIRAHIAELERLALYLSPPPGKAGLVRVHMTVVPSGTDPEAVRADARRRDSAWDVAEEILGLCQGVPASAPVPTAARRKFFELAEGFSFGVRPDFGERGEGDARSLFSRVPGYPSRIEVGEQGHPVAELAGAVPAGLEAPDEEDVHFGPDIWFEPSDGRGGAIAALLDYFTNKHRDRLKRCGQCRRWFVDKTRNLSAFRCSRGCTIKWSNAQRGVARDKGGSPARRTHGAARR